MADRLRRLVAVVCLTAWLALVSPGQARANDLLGGVADIVSGVLSLPVNTLVGTFTGPPVIGTVSGLLQGTLIGVTKTVRGAARVAKGTVPLVAAVVPWVI